MIGLLLLLAAFVVIAVGGPHPAIIAAVVIGLPLAGIYLCLTGK
jgi:uncharacterized MnhB-related membrane protein